MLVQADPADAFGLGDDVLFVLDFAGSSRHIAVVCDAASRGAAAQIARDVNEEERHVYVRGLFQISELQIVPPLAWDERAGLTREPE